jgi:ribosome assembly protein YihI (activator of Der GTPase)
MGFRNKELASRAGKLSSRKGIPNRATSEVREAFKQLVENNLPQMQSDLDSLEPKERIKFMLDMAKLILPQLQSISIDDLREKEVQGFNVLTINLKNGSDDSDDSNSRI